jgi:hypothetical protein
MTADVRPETSQSRIGESGLEPELRGNANEVSSAQVTVVPDMTQKRSFPFAFRMLGV